MADLTSNPQSGFDWEDACLDPHHSSLQAGRTEGREAGALAGFREGRGLGQTKGLEFGLEVGFYQGVVKALRGKHHNDRIQKNIEKLQEAIDDFPTPDELFEATKHHISMSEMRSQNPVTGHPDEHDDSENPSKFDILNKLQRIRARFKLLTVQLGKPKFSLKNVLEDSLRRGTEPGKETPDDDAW